MSSEKGNEGGGDRGGGGGDGGHEAAELERVERALDEDLLGELLDDGADDEAIDEELRAAGADPEAIASSVRAQVEEALAEEQALLPWQRLARRKRRRQARWLEDEQGPRGSGSRPLARAELLRRIDEARRHPRLEGRVQAYFRGREPHEASDEELRGLLEDLEILRRLSEAVNGTRGRDEGDDDGGGHR